MPTIGSKKGKRAEDNDNSARLEIWTDARAVLTKSYHNEFTEDCKWRKKIVQKESGRLLNFVQDFLRDHEKKCKAAGLLDDAPKPQQERTP